VCVCGRVHLMLTNVMQCWIKHRELLWKDVLLHSKRPGVGTGDVEVLLAEHHAELRPQGAEGGGDTHTHTHTHCCQPTYVFVRMHDEHLCKEPSRRGNWMPPLFSSPTLTGHDRARKYRNLTSI